MRVRFCQMLIPYFVSVFLHIFSAAVWLGGTVLIIWWYRKGRNRGTQDLLHYCELPVVFTNLTWLVFFILLVTGLYNLFVRGYSWYDLIGSEFWQGYFGETLMVKLIIFCGVLVFTGVNHVFLKKIFAEQNGDAADKLKQKALVVSYLSLTLGLCILFCAIMLVRGRPW